MGNYRLAEMAKETLQIAKQGFYYLDGKKIELTKINGMYAYDDVSVLDEDKLNEIEDDEDEFFERCFYATKVEPGDLFLFFGNYHKVKFADGKYQYIKKTGDFYSDNDLQLIWGYLQVDKIITDPEEQRKYSWHPHSDGDRIKVQSNVMFKARETLSFNSNMAGAGVLKYREDRVLTAKDCNKATWIKRSIYDRDAIIGNRKNSSKNNDGIYYSGIWQELGLHESLECEEWAKSIIQ